MTIYAFQMVSPIKDGKMSQMTKERVIQHEVLWSEVPSPTIEASVQPTVPNQPFVKQINHWSGFVRNLFLKNSR